MRNTKHQTILSSRHSQLKLASTTCPFPRQCSISFDPRFRNSTFNCLSTDVIPSVLSSLTFKTVLALFFVCLLTYCICDGTFSLFHPLPPLTRSQFLYFLLKEVSMKVKRLSNEMAVRRKKEEIKK